MIGRPESGSLAARSEIKSKLAFFPDPQVTKTNGLRLSTASSSSTNGTEESQAGWILKHALDLHFLKERPFLEDTPPFDPPLAEYIKEVFIQLDYHKTGTVSREDFDILCRFLDITSSPPQSYRNSGIEWLSSYRTHSPVSPLKADKISDVKYHRSTEGGESEGTSSLSTRPSSIQNPNFLFTFGPRPFWELWPQKKRRKKRLNFEEFTRSLLEQWAKSKGISLSKVNHCFPPIVVPPRRRKGTYRTKYYRLLPEDSTPPSEPKHVVILQRPSSFDDTRTKRFVRNANRISRRCHFLKRLSRRSHFNPLLPRPSQVEALEKQVIQQKGEIKSLREAIHEMRSSLHLSDAQNLALQVLLRKMKDISSGVGASPSSSSEVKPSFASRSVAESEKQLENLVHELREMSQTKYPSVGSSSAHQASYSSNNSTLYNTKLDDSPFEEEIAATSAALGGAKDDLILTQKELQQTVLKLQLKEIELEENSMNLTDAYKALELAQEELNKLRYDLEEAQTALETTKQELSETNDDLAHTKRTLNRTDSTLKETEKRLSQLSQNRLSLVLELNTTREILASSLNKVQDLELKTQKVPYLEARIKELEESRSSKKCKGNEESHLKTTPQTHPLRPLSTIDSGLYSTSSSDSDDSKGGCVKGALLDSALVDDTLKSPPDARPPKPPRLIESNKSDGRFIGFSNPCGPGSSTNVLLHSSSKSVEDKVLLRLRKEIQDLKTKFSDSREQWNQEKSQLIENKILSQFEDPEFQVLEAERIRLSLLEEKIKEVLSMLRALNSMNISPSSLGKLVLDAVEHSIDPNDGEIQVFKFLNHLYHGTRDYERVSGENMIQKALDAIDKENQETGRTIDESHE
ncbi:unnamed protein product [Lepeophtheirus salmonis]|uniref:(salmon louse) hypothetical protein n=1 Tax=Lepeophtheirus salmonis TaxID=72036 RepID=A0A7R8H332_LEPSM|nr:unnamed protein product [Lepeophtheirus salmonis]CAF2823401.1 unnamed protein product [Lepeophtheirus salmonis]